MRESMTSQVNNYIDKVVDESMKHMGHNPFSRSDFVRATEQVVFESFKLRVYTNGLPPESMIPNFVDEVIGLLSDYMGDY